MAKCPRCGEDYNGILCGKCGYTPFPEDEPSFDKDESLSEPEKTVVSENKEDGESHISRYVWSFLLPVVGIILGAILLSKPDKDSRSSGSFCLIWSVISLLIFGFSFYIYWTAYVIV